MFEIAQMFNETILNPTVRVAVDHFLKSDENFCSKSFVQAIMYQQHLPAISVSGLISALNSAGVKVRGAYATLVEIRSEQFPILCFILPQDQSDSNLILVQIARLEAQSAILNEDGFGVSSISLSELKRRWSGIIVHTQSPGILPRLSAEAAQFNEELSVLNSFLSAERCNLLIAYAEKCGFSRSKVISHVNGVDVQDTVLAARSSSSVVLTDRSQGLLKPLYERCADIEGVSADKIEMIQCVRYRTRQKFRPHFDGGIGVLRRTTFLVYLNDDFEGGETYFPILGKLIQPVAGNCLRFPSCSADGCIIPSSAHGGLPISAGVKYALNIWVQC